MLIRGLSLSLIRVHRRSSAVAFLFPRTSFERTTASASTGPYA
jgi:hypothetical protein